MRWLQDSWGAHVQPERCPQNEGNATEAHGTSDADSIKSCTRRQYLLNLSDGDLMAFMPCSCSSGTDHFVHHSQPLGTFGPRMLCRALGRGGHRSKHVVALIRSSPLLGKRCTPCEKDIGSLGSMGMCKAMSRDQAESMLAGEVGYSFSLFAYSILPARCAHPVHGMCD